LQPAIAPAAINGQALPVFGTLDKNVILVNADGHRIDMPLPPKSAAVADALKRKIYVDGKKFCHMYHLYGSCVGGCGYVHGQVSAGEKLVMRHKMRGQKCHDRAQCRDPLCFYGHHCACLGGKKCGFPVAMHGAAGAAGNEDRIDVVERRFRPVLGLRPTGGRQSKGRSEN
jgi:hypothetical protein